MKRGGESIAERVARTKAAKAAEEEQATRLADHPEDVPAVRHCWYDGPHGRQATLLLEWRNRAGTWCGRIMVAQLEDDGWVMASLWVDGAMLEPA